MGGQTYDRIWSITHAHRCVLVNYLLTIKTHSVALIRETGADEDARGLPICWLSNYNINETEAHITSDFQNYRHLLKLVKYGSTGVDSHHTRSYFDVTLYTMLPTLCLLCYYCART